MPELHRGTDLPVEAPRQDCRLFQSGNQVFRLGSFRFGFGSRIRRGLRNRPQFHRRLPSPAIPSSTTVSSGVVPFAARAWSPWPSSTSASISGCVVDFAEGVLVDRACCAECQTHGLFVLGRICHPNDAEPAEAVEFTIARLGRKGSEIYGNLQARAFDRPENGLARPGVAPRQQFADRVTGIEMIPRRQFGEALAADVGGLRSYCGRELLGNLAETPVGIDLPDKPHRPGYSD